MKHARLGLSNSRWPLCFGSVREEAAYPDVPGDAAIDGTGSHLLLELTAHLGKCNQYLGQTIGVGHEDKPEGWLVDQDRIHRVNDCLAYIQRRITEMGGAAVHTERRSNPGAMFGRDDWWGTTDISLIGITHKVIEIIDYKDGRMVVSADDNSQLLGNAIGVCHENRITGVDDYTVRMTIVQPRTSPVIRYTEMNLFQLGAAAERLHIAAVLTDDPTAPLIAGSHCTWCKHGRAGNCPAQSSIAMEGLQTIMTDTVGQTSMIEAIKSGQIAPGTMSESQIAAILDVGKVVTKLVKQVEEEALSRLQAGSTIPGYEIGTGRSSREWSDDEDIVAGKLKGMRFKKDEIYPSKLVTPAQAEKKEDLSERQLANMAQMIVSVAGKAKVVPAKVEVVTAELMFKNIPAEIDFLNVELDFM